MGTYFYGREYISGLKSGFSASASEYFNFSSIYWQRANN